MNENNVPVTIRQEDQSKLHASELKEQRESQRRGDSYTAINTIVALAAARMLAVAEWDQLEVERLIEDGKEKEKIASLQANITRILDAVDLMEQWAGCWA